MYNTIFQILGWLVSLLLFVLLFKVKNFTDLMNIKVFESKKFIFLWINVMWVLYAFCFVQADMSNTGNSIYYIAAQSDTGVIFKYLSSIFLIGLIYYPLVDIVFFLIYKTNFKLRILDISLIFGALIIVWNAVSVFQMKFTFDHLFLNLYNFVWFLLILYSLKYVKEKRA